MKDGSGHDFLCPRRQTTGAHVADVVPMSLMRSLGPMGPSAHDTVTHARGRFALVQVAPRIWEASTQVRWNWYW